MRAATPWRFSTTSRSSACPRVSSLPIDTGTFTRCPSASTAVIPCALRRSTRNGRAAAGWSETLEAASDGRIELLLFQDGADREAWQCPSCGRAASAPGSCPLDGTRMVAQTNVKSVLKPGAGPAGSKAVKRPAMLTADQPINVTSASMTYNQQTGHADRETELQPQHPAAAERAQCDAENPERGPAGVGQQHGQRRACRGQHAHHRFVAVAGAVFA